MGTKVKELPRVLDLPTRAPKLRADEILHSKVWAWAKTHPGVSWKRRPSSSTSA